MEIEAVMMQRFCCRGVKKWQNAPLVQAVTRNFTVGDDR